MVRRHPELAEVAHEEYTVVLNLARLKEQQSPYVFEGSSFAIWTRIDGTRTEEQIVDELVAEYGASRNDIARDVHAFLEELLELGLVIDGASPDSNPAHLD